MVDDRSRSRRVLAHLLRTPPLATAALAGKAARGTLMVVPSSSGAFLVLSVHGWAAMTPTLTLRIGEAAWQLPFMTADGLCWCSFFTRSLPRAETVCVETAAGERVVSGRLRATDAH
ncbi:MAG: hypothetical protein IJK64_00680 [Clostridia bacterium]|nr:hypothetical protein [Clostridia bacterium]